MSAADQQIPDATRVGLEEMITETGRCLLFRVLGRRLQSPTRPVS